MGLPRDRPRGESPAGGGGRHRCHQDDPRDQRHGRPRRRHAERPGERGHLGLYAQDKWGNVWYLGEDTTEFENGKVVSTAGSWQAGVDGAQAGIIIPARPQVGLAFRQEYYAGEAEDRARILSLDEVVEVPYGAFRNVLMTRDTTPLHPEILEHKLYAKGIGPVAVFGISGGSGREELVRFEAGA